MPKASQELFISYSRSDDAFVRRLLNELDKEAVPYWSDRQIRAGSIWIDEIESAVKRASVFALLISPGFAKSKYAQFEAGIAVGRAQASGACIVPILLPGASLPSILRSYQALYVESMSVEQIAEQLAAIVATCDQKSEPAQTELRLFVSAPADVTAEREVVSRVVEELNMSLAVDEGITLRRYIWESLPSVERAQPQEAQNDMLRRVDVFVLILANRLGTPIGVGCGSGTEEEFRLVADAWRRTGRPQILCYLKTTPVKLESTEALDQLRRVMEFTDQLKREGLVYEFESLDDLEHALRLHLRKFIQSASSRLTKK